MVDVTREWFILEVMYVSLLLFIRGVGLTNNGVASFSRKWGLRDFGRGQMFIEDGTCIYPRPHHCWRRGEIFEIWTL